MSSYLEWTRPCPVDASGKLATKLGDFRGAYDEFVEARRAFTGAAKDAPTFPTNKFFDPNQGLLTVKQSDALLDAETEAAAGTVEVPSRYDPVRIEVAHALNCRTLRRGSVSKHPEAPEDWDEKEFGPWMDSYDEDGETVLEPSGLFFDETLPRQAHADKAEDLVTDEKALLTFGNLRVVCGDGTHDGAAAFVIRAHKSGNYGRCDDARKRLSLAGNKEVKNVVFRIEDRANNGGAFVMKSRWVSGARVITGIPFMPGQVLTAGNLFDKGGKQLDAKAIRKLDGDTKGLKFKALAAPIVGKAVSFDDMWSQISQDKKGVKALRERDGRSDEYEAGSPRDKSITNIGTTARISPFARNAFGFRSVQADMPPFTQASGDGDVTAGHFSMGVVIGSRTVDEWNRGVNEAKKAAAPAPAPAPAPKKAAKKAAAKSDAAPKVEHNTAEDETAKRISLAEAK